MKTIYKKTIVLCIIVLTLFTTACDVKEFVSREVIADTLNPRASRDSQILRVAWQGEAPIQEIENAIYEGLVRVNEKGLIQKGSGLAKDWDITEDGLTYTFHLRQAYWSDGSEITAHDFQNAWFDMLEPSSSHPQVELLYAIKNGRRYHHQEIEEREVVGIRVEDEKTLVITLEKPMGSFIDKVASSVYFARDTERFSGPFLMIEQEQDESVVLRKNTHYWDEENVALEKIEGLILREELQGLHSFNKREIHITTVPPGQYPSYSKDPRNKVVSTGVVWWIQFNNKDTIFKNEKIRRALAYGLHREKLVEEILAKGDTAAYGVVPLGIVSSEDQSFREESGKLFDDVGDDEAIQEVAQQLLEKGLKEVRRNKSHLKNTTLLVPDTPLSRNMGEAIQQMWKEYLGVEINVEALSIPLLLDRMERGEYHMAYTGWAGDHSAPEAFLNLWRGNDHYNDTGWKNGDFEKWIDEAAIISGSERVQRLIRAEKALINQMPVTPIYFRNELQLVAKEVKGWTHQPVGGIIEYKYMRLE